MYLTYLIIQIYQEFELHNKHLLIDVFYEKIKKIHKDFLKYDNKNSSLLESVNDYIKLRKNFILENLNECIEK